MSEIVVLGHPSLTSKSLNVEKIDDYIVSLTKKMTQIISLEDVDQVAKNMLENKTFGRIVVDVNL